MMIGAACVLESLVTEEDFAKGIVLPDVFNKDVVPRVAQVVRDIARKSGVLKSCE